MQKRGTKLEVVTKPKKVNKPKIVHKKRYDKYKKHVIRQLKILFESKKKNYRDYDDEEYRGIRDLEYLKLLKMIRIFTNLKESRMLLKMVFEIIITLYMKEKEANIMIN